VLRHHRNGRQLRGPLPDPVHLDVVRVAVAAVVVVDGEDVRLLLVEDDREPARRVLDLRLPEAVRGRVARLPHHPRVGVAEELHALGPDRGGRGVALRRPAHGQLLTGLEHARHGLAELPAGGEHQHDAVPCGRSPREGARGADRLVVGVCVKGDDGSHAMNPTQATMSMR
jgi:hypothetical protein